MIGLREIEATRDVIRDLRSAGAAERADAVEAVLAAATAELAARRDRVRRDVLTIRQAARALGVSVQTIAEWDDAGHFPLVRVGERQVLRRDDLVRYLDNLGAQQRRGGAAAQPPWLRGRHSGTVTIFDDAQVDRAQTLHAEMESGRALSADEQLELAELERALANTAAAQLREVSRTRPRHA